MNDIEIPAGGRHERPVIPTAIRIIDDHQLTATDQEFPPWPPSTPSSFAYISIGSVEPQFYAQLLELTGLAAGSGSATASRSPRARYPIGVDGVVIRRDSELRRSRKDHGIRRTHANSSG